MRRLALSLLVLVLWATGAAAQGMPKVGDPMTLTGLGDSKLQWSYNAPNANDAAGRVVVHWFCTPKVAACVDDLARIVTLREAGGVYIIAYINGSQRDAKKLDPIRESEGVGRGTVASGPSVKKLFKDLGIAKGPASIVVDVDGKVKLVSTSGDINELDSRDEVIKGLVDAVKPYTTTNKAPTKAKVGEKMTFSITVNLASWLSYSKKSTPQLTFTAAKEVKCEPQHVTQADKAMTVSVTCTAPKGSYQARGDIRFGYDSPNGATGLGQEGATWKFDVAP
ncbi:MAG TPA: hypothetical protein VFV99_04040 [Kofleriaceae bacterium]|nr:hypothetical protein [Kofleriaceae bacterium]